MDRDFTRAKVSQLLKIVEEENAEKWRQLIVGDWIEDIFSKEMGVPNDIADMTAYHQHIIDKKNYGRGKMKQLLIDVKNVDGDYKEQFGLSEDWLNIFAKKIRALAGMFNEGKLNSNVSDFKNEIDNINRDYNVVKNEIEAQISEIDLRIFLRKYANFDENGNLVSLRPDGLAWLVAHPDQFKAEAALAYSILGEFIFQHDIELFNMGKALPFADQIPFFNSFEYDEVNDFYYTNETGTQSLFGFMDIMDTVGEFLGMKLATDTINYDYDGKSYDLRLWRGTYGKGNAYGAEIGLYVNTEGEDSVWKPCAKGDDQRQMTVKIYEKPSEEAIAADANDPGRLLMYNDNQQPGQDGDHFWNLTIHTDPGHQYAEDNIYVEYTFQANLSGNPGEDEYSIVLKSLIEETRKINETGNIKIISTDSKTGEIRFTWGK